MNSLLAISMDSLRGAIPSFTSHVRSPQLLVLAFLFVLTSSVISHQSVAAQDSRSFGVIDGALSPRDLAELLGTSSAVKQNVLQNEVSKMVVDKLKNLDPKSLSKFSDLVKQFSRNGSQNDLRDKAKQIQELMKSDPQFKSSVEELSKNLKQKGVDFGQGNDGSFDIDKLPLDNNRLTDQNNLIDDELRRQIENQIRRYSDNPRKLDQHFNGANSLSQNSPNISRQNQTGIDPGAFQNFPGRNPSNGNGFNPRGNGSSNSRQGNNASGSPIDPSGSPDGSRSMPSNPSPPSSTPGSSQPTTGLPPNYDQSQNPFRDGQSDSMSRGPSSFGSSQGQSPQQSPDSSQNDQAGSPKANSPKENVGRKFNQVIMKSINNAVERKLGGESSTAPNGLADGSKSSFDRLLSKLVQSVENGDQSVGNSGGSKSRGIFGSTNKVINNFTKKMKTGNSSWNNFGSGGGFSGGGGMSLPNFSVRNLVYFLAFAALMVFAIIFIIKKTSLGAILGLKEPASQNRLRPDYSHPFSHSSEIVKSIDRLTLWLFGTKSEWWNSQIVANELAANRPELTDEIDQIITVYDNARYAPDDNPVVQQTSTDFRSTLIKLADQPTHENNRAQRSNES